MDTDLLKTFLEVNRTRHFGQAANNLFLTSAAVSARIRQLEHSLGVELFQRSRNNIQLTPAGERLVPHAESLLRAWGQARQEVVAQSEQQPLLCLGATANLWQFGLSQKLNAALAALPEARVRALAHPSSTINQLLQERVLDLAIMPEPPEIEGFCAEKVGQMKLVLVSSDPATKLKTALQDGYVAVDWGLSFELFHARRFGDAGLPLLQTNLALLALERLRGQVGAAWLPQSVLNDAAGANLVQVAGAPLFSRPLFGVYRAASDHKGLISQLLARLNPLQV